MKPFVGELMVLAALLQCGCSTAERPRPPLQVFYEQAKERLRTGDLHSKLSLDGLRFFEGTPAHAPKAPNWDESSIIVADAAGSSAAAVQIIVHPRVSGSFLDPQFPSDDFLREQAHATEDALRHHRYTGVFRIQNPAHN
jgi:hypothetical protein